MTQVIVVNDIEVDLWKGQPSSVAGQRRKISTTDRKKKGLGQEDLLIFDVRGSEDLLR